MQNRANMKPILFNTEMVRAILDDRKTVTRRVIKPQLPQNLVEVHNVDPIGYLMFKTSDTLLDGWSNGKSPYQVGDILYVQETWRVFQTYPAVLGYDVLYKSDELIQPCIFSDMDRYIRKFMKYQKKNGWQSPYFMPKEAARIFLRVTDVRVERLRDITTDECHKEGIEVVGTSNFGTHYNPVNYDFSLEKFETLWDSTIKKQDLDRYGWEANPWVWVIEFERISKEEISC